MKQIQVDKVQVQFFEGSINSSSGRFIAVILKPELAGHKNFFPGDAAILDGLAYFGFVKIGGSRINMAIADSQRFFDRIIGRTIIGNHIDAKTDGMNGVAVIQQDILHR